jgi:hypothetical protein
MEKVTIRFEKIGINPKARRLSEKWIVERGEDVVLFAIEPWYKVMWYRIKGFFKK